MNEYIMNDAKVILAYVLKSQAGLILLNANSTTNNLGIMRTYDESIRKFSYAGLCSSDFRSKGTVG